jgi:hypothetical protein
LPSRATRIPQNAPGGYAFEEDDDDDDDDDEDEDEDEDEHEKTGGN